MGAVVKRECRTSIGWESCTDPQVYWTLVPASKSQAVFVVASYEVRGVELGALQP